MGLYWGRYCRRKGGQSPFSSGCPPVLEGVLTCEQVLRAATSWLAATKSSKQNRRRSVREGREARPQRTQHDDHLPSTMREIGRLFRQVLSQIPSSNPKHQPLPTSKPNREWIGAWDLTLSALVCFKSALVRISTVDRDPDHRPPRASTTFAADDLIGWATPPLHEHVRLHGLDDLRGRALAEQRDRATQSNAPSSSARSSSGVIGRPRLVRLTEASLFSATIRASPSAAASRR